MTTASQDIDADVVARSIGEPQHFAVVFDRHYVGIHRYAGRRLGQDFADDIASETFLVAFARRSRYDLTQPDARPWLYGIASNLIARHHRAEQRRYRAIARAGADDIGLSRLLWTVPAPPAVRADAFRALADLGNVTDLGERDGNRVLRIDFAELPAADKFEGGVLPDGVGHMTLVIDPETSQLVSMTNYQGTEDVLVAEWTNDMPPFHGVVKSMPPGMPRATE
jgi:DNA-directed RNA polymerase specialized sigma24 family protein